MFEKFAIALSLPALLAPAADMPRMEHPHRADREQPAYLSLETIELPIFENGWIEGRVFVKLVIEGQNREATQSLSNDLPRIRARLLSALVEFNRLHVSGLAPIDAEQLSRTLNSKATLPDAGIRRILIVELSSIPI